MKRECRQPTRAEWAVITSPRPMVRCVRERRQTTERSGVSEYRNREEVMDLMLRVRTLEECERARELAIRWIEEHPADQDYILLAGEHLERVRQALLEQEEEGTA